jgi:hypothetical protein
MTFILPPRTVPCELSRAPGVILPLANLDKAIAELSVADVNAGVDVKPPPLAREAVPGVDLGVRQRQPQINCPPAWRTRACGRVTDGHIDLVRAAGLVFCCHSFVPA